MADGSGAARTEGTGKTTKHKQGGYKRFRRRGSDNVVEMSPRLARRYELAGERMT